jgi:UDP-glucose 4-epimerase
MHVLVTGGAGYIGSVIVEELMKAGHIPIVYDSLINGHRDALDGNVTLIRGDIADVEHLRATLRKHKVEAVLHMAASIEVGFSLLHPDLFFANNVGGSISVLRAVVDTGVKKIILSSTASIYGETDGLPVSEDTPPHPANPYAESKLMVEQMFEWAAQAYNLVCTSLRYFNAAGATGRNGEQHTPETHLIPLVLRAAEENRPIALFGADYPTPDGTCIRDYVHVIDLARAHLLALKREGVGSRVYNVGAGTGYSVRQIIDAASKVTGIPLAVNIQPRRPGDEAASIADTQRIRHELGWVPRHSDMHTILESAWKWRQSHPGGYLDK